MEAAQPFKITIEHYDTKYAIEKDRSDLDVTEFMDMVEQSIYSVGYHKDCIDDYIIEWGEELKNKK